MANSGFPYDVDPLSTGQYDDAWQTEGWTAQNPVYPNHDTGPTPADGITYVKVTGSFFTGEGKPLYGQFRFVPKTREYVYGTSHFLFRTHKAYAKRGGLEVTLPVASYGPPTVYRVHQRVGPVKREYDLVLGPDNTEFDLSGLSAPVEDNFYG